MTVMRTPSIVSALIKNEGRRLRTGRVGEDDLEEAMPARIT